jgi:predicted transcriptional regulator
LKTSFLLMHNILNNIYLKEGIHIYLISKKLNVTYSHLFSIIQNMERNKLIRTAIIGRERRSFLLKKGEEFLEHSTVIKHLLGDIEL